VCCRCCFVSTGCKQSPVAVPLAMCQSSPAPCVTEWCAYPLRGHIVWLRCPEHGMARMVCRRACWLVCYHHSTVLCVRHGYLPRWQIPQTCASQHMRPSQLSQKYHAGQHVGFLCACTFLLCLRWRPGADPVRYCGGGLWLLWHYLAIRLGWRCSHAADDV
jgi:hypothetical protein